MLISKRITVTISVLGITTAALYGAVAIPSILSIRDLRTKTAAEHAKIERRYALRDVMRNSLAGLESAKLHVAQLSTLAIKEGEELTFVNALEEAALEVGVEQDIVLETVNQKNTSGWERDVPIRITLSGDFTQAIRYLEKVERLPYHVGIDSVSVQPFSLYTTGDADGKVRMELTGKVYWQSAAAPEFTTSSVPTAGSPL